MSKGKQKIVLWFVMGVMFLTGLSWKKLAVQAAEEDATYVPYAGAKYRLVYCVNHYDSGDEIEIKGAEYDEADKNNLGKLVIPEKIDEITVTTIGKSAFYGCAGFTGDLNIPNSVVSIGKGAFSETQITSVKISDSVKKIGKEAFYRCDSLKNVELGTGIEEIEDHAFNGGETKEFIIYGKNNIVFGKKALGYEGFIWGYNGSSAEKYAQETAEFTFLSLEGKPAITDYKVSTKEELEEAIGSNRRIILADGIYELSKSLRVESMTYLIIEAEHTGMAEILLTDGNVPVVNIERSAKITIDGCILGHDSVSIREEGCGPEGYVVYLSSSFDVKIENCDMYGCGVEGVYCSPLSRCWDIRLDYCVIRDCMRCVASFNKDVFYCNCIFSGNSYNEKCAANYAGFYHFDPKCENCLFVNNYSKEFISEGQSKEQVINCTFCDNVWDNKTPKAYGICLNGITWQVQGDVVKIGYPIQVDDSTVISSKKGVVLSYSESALPWKKYIDLKVDVADGVKYNEPVRQYTIIYHYLSDYEYKNGGMYNTYDCVEKKASSNKEIVLEPPKEIACHVFAGWYTDELYQNRVEVIPVGTKEDVELIAKYEENHTYDTGRVTKEPTCAEDGEKIYQCTVCGKEKTEIIEKTGKHTYDAGTIVVEPTCIKEGAKKYTCTVCKGSKMETLEKSAHNFEETVTAATLTQDGQNAKICTACGTTEESTVIYHPQKIALSATEYVYNGKVRKPGVKVTDTQGKEISASNYQLTYGKGCKNVGKYKVTITFQGNYQGEKTLNFTINPAAVKLKTVSAGSKSLTVKWAKNTKQTSGYELQYSTSKSFAKKNTKTVTIKKNTVTSQKITKLKAKKKYYVRIRTYKTVSGKKYYSEWSKVSSAVTKK